MFGKASKFVQKQRLYNSDVTNRLIYGRSRTGHTYVLAWKCIVSYSELLSHNKIQLGVTSIAIDPIINV